MEIKDKYRKLFVFIPLIIVAVMLSLLWTKEDVEQEKLFTLKDDFSSFGLLMEESVQKLGIKDLELKALPEDEFVKKNYGNRDIFEIKDRYTDLRNKTYIPFIKSTIVFAIDKSKVRDNIDSWKSLINSDYPVLVADSGTDLGVSSILALNMGLGFDERDLYPAEHVIQLMEEESRVFYLDRYKDENMNLVNIGKPNHYPIVILWDYQAAYIKENINGNFDLVVPKDGTLTTDMGLMTAVDKGRESDDFYKLVKFMKSSEGKRMIIDNSFRTIDGYANRDIYPEEDSYSSAKSVKSFAVWNKTLSRLYRGETGPTIRQKLFLSCIFIVLWSFYGFKRLPKSNIRKYFTAISALLICWAGLRFARSIPNLEDMNLMFWYLYYFPINMIPLMFYYILYIYRRKEEGDIPKRTKWTTFAVTVFFAVMAATNNYHSLFFKFIPVDYTLEDNYVYQLFYYLDMVWISALIGMCIYNLYKILIYRNKKTLMDILILYIALITAFLFLYANGIVELDLTVTMILMIIGVEEIIIRYILIESQFMDLPFFEKSNNIMIVLDKNLNIVYTSENGKSLKELITKDMIRQRLRSIDGEGFVLDKFFPKRYFTKLYSTSNGYLMMLQDITEIYELNKELNKKNLELKNKRRLLDKEKDVRSELSSLRVSVKLLNNIEYAIEDNLIILKEYLKDMYDGNNIQYNADHIYALQIYKTESADVGSRYEQRVYEQRQI